MIDHRDAPYGPWTSWDTFAIVSTVGAVLLCIAGAVLGWVAA